MNYIAKCLVIALGIQGIGYSLYSMSPKEKPVITTVQKLVDQMKKELNDARLIKKYPKIIKIIRKCADSYGEIRSIKQLCQIHEALSDHTMSQLDNQTDMCVFFRLTYFLQSNYDLSGIDQHEQYEEGGEEIYDIFDDSSSDYSLSGDEEEGADYEKRRRQRKDDWSWDDV